MKYDKIIGIATEIMSRHLLKGEELPRGFLEGGTLYYFRKLGNSEYRISDDIGPVVEISLSENDYRKDPTTPPKWVSLR